ncbi:peptide chain release factor N(5)-glutamine methyltransferase [Entomobacter blattae]|uniref:Release factor glutamine methyltransferase n=1 Tax=Entomobacter blattae TaxID=2762277 RepID=A0A7H1NTL8_9PROT|nr:peptide chain release factor N(5)-glutamine methyltransferase [Entomobacter blattae]QNT79128.1 Release factor glutamine methyltransferase [Entomobacter blattae]
MNSYFDFSLKAMPLEQALHWGRDYLAGLGVEEPEREALLLLSAALNVEPMMLRLADKRQDVATEVYFQYLKRRGQKEPFAYITGYKGFWSLNFKVNPSTLIPRPETELLIETVLKKIPHREEPLRVLDIGTGTGCILLSVLSEYCRATGLGTDISEAVIALATENAHINHLHARSRFMVTEGVREITENFDVVFSNPPYIPTKDIVHLMPDVRLYEPMTALDGGDEGMDMYKNLFLGLKNIVKPEGIGFFEIGVGQECQVITLAEKSGWQIMDVVDDLSGIPRVISFQHQRKGD